MKNELFGGLIEFDNQSKLIEFVESIDNKMSLKIIEGAMEYGVRNGLFSLEESYCLYKSLYSMKICVDTHVTEFKGSSRYPEVELDDEKKSEG